MPPRKSKGTKKKKAPRETIQSRITNMLLRSELNRIPREVISIATDVVTDEVAKFIRKIELEKAIDHIAANYRLKINADINLEPTSKAAKRAARSKVD